MFKEILLTANAHPRNTIDLGIRLASYHNSKLNVLYIIDFNKHEILGDEWISDPKTRREFFDYFEKGMNEQANSILTSIKKKSESYQLKIQPTIKQGNPEKIIIEALNNMEPPGLGIIPHPVVPLDGALKINAGKIIKSVKYPVLVVPEN